MSSLLIGVVVAVAASIAVGALYVYLSQGRILFQPSTSLDLTPYDAGLAYEDVSIPVVDGESIHGWYVASEDAAASVLFCHGNAGNISHRLETLRMLNDLDLNVLIFDYRGYGRSDGKPGEDNMYADALAAFKWLQTIKEVPAERIFVFGRSLGGAVGIELAGGVDCGGLIVESSFTSVIDMGKVLYPFLPVKWMARYSFDSYARISRVRCPILIMHSRKDEIVPFEMGQRLYEAAPKPKQFVELTGTHNDLLDLSDEGYRRYLSEFIQ